MSDETSPTETTKTELDNTNNTDSTSVIVPTASIAVVVEEEQQPQTEPEEYAASSANMDVVANTTGTNNDTMNTNSANADADSIANEIAAVTAVSTGTEENVNANTDTQSNNGQDTPPHQPRQRTLAEWDAIVDQEILEYNNHHRQNSNAKNHKNDNNNNNNHNIDIENTVNISDANASANADSSSSSSTEMKNDEQNSADDTEEIKSSDMDNHNDHDDDGRENIANHLLRCTNSLDWDDIAFVDVAEKEECRKLYDTLLSTVYNKKYRLQASNCPPFEVARFFVGSKNRIPKALKKWHLMMDIYAKHKLWEVTEPQVRDCFKKMYKTMRFGGYDKNGAIIIAMQYKNWFPDEYKNTDILMKAFLLLLHSLTEDMDVSRHGLIFVADCKDFGWANFSLEMEKLFTVLMQDAYPMRLKAMYMVDAPWIINTIMTIMKPFLSTKMQERMFIVDRIQLMQNLEITQIPVLIGGQYDEETVKPFYPHCIRFAHRTDLSYLSVVDVATDSNANVDANGNGNQQSNSNVISA